MVGIRFSSKKEKLRRLPFFKRNFYVFYLFLLIEKTITQYHIHSHIHSKNASITFQFSWFCPIFRKKKKIEFLFVFLGHVLDSLQNSWYKFRVQRSFSFFQHIIQESWIHQFGNNLQKKLLFSTKKFWRKINKKM